MTPENKEEIKRLRAGASDGEWIYDKHKQVVMSRGEFLFALQGAKIPDRNFILAAKDMVDDLWAALEETERLLTDHGPNGRNYTNEQYITILQQLVRKTDELTEAQQTIALKQSSIETLTGQVVDETALHAKTAAKLIVAEQTIARQREALKWYADPDKHEIKRRLLGDYAPITLDKGDKARAALGEGAKES